jgi:hypothetical protein
MSTNTAVYVCVDNYLLQTYIYFAGIEYQDTKVALGIYGVNMAAAYASIALIKKRNLKYVSD